MAYSRTYTRINWQDEPSEATALESLNLNKMDSALYELDGRTVDMSGRLDNDETAIGNKVDKVSGKGLSTNDYTNAEKTKLAGIEMGANKTIVDSALSGSSTNPVQNKVVKSALDGKSTVSVTPVVTEGTTLATISIDGVDTDIKGSDIEVDSTPSATSENPLQNKAIYEMLNNLLPEETVQGNPIAISDASGLNAKACSVDLLPIQDLHGYDSPWVGGAGKNKLQNNGTSKTENGVTFTVNSDGSVTIKTESGGATNNTNFLISAFTGVDGMEYTLNGIPSGLSSINMTAGNLGATDIGSGATFTYDSTKTDKNVRIWCLTGFTATTPITVYPMIRLSSVTDGTFAPYSNNCPISGRNSVEIKRTGKNLCNPANISVFNSNKYFSTLNYSTVPAIPVKESTHYVLSCRRGVPSAVGGQDIRIYFWDIDGVLISYASNGSFDTPQNCVGISFYVGYSDGDFTDGNDVKAQVEEGSTATTYEPYNGLIVIIQFGQTVYGGTLDVLTGKLLVNKVLLTFNGTEDWSYTQGAFLLVNAFNEPNNTFNLFAQNPTSNKYVAVTRISNVSEIAGIANNSMFNQTGTNYKRLWVKDNSCSTAEAFKASLATTPLQICYTPLNTTEITLTAEQISLLRGNNVVSTDGDNINLVYSADIGLYIAGQLQNS